MALRVTTVTKRRLPVVRLQGELDVSQAAKLQSRITELVAEGHTNVILNMMQLDYLDSSGLGSLVALAKVFRAGSGRLVLITNDFVDEILAITRLSDLFQSTSSEEDALRLLEDPRGHQMRSSGHG